MNPSEFQEIVDEYFSSTREILETAEGLLLQIEKDESPPPERLLDLRRAFHTLKGNSSMMGFGVVADLAHLMEDLFRRAESGDLAVGGEVVSHLLAGLGLVSEIAAAGRVPDETPASWRGVMAALRDVGTGVAPPPAPAGTAPGLSPDAPPTDDLKRHYLAPRTRFVRVSEAALDSLLEHCGELHVLLSGLSDRALGRANGSEVAAAEAEAVERIVTSFHLLEDEVLAARLVPVGTVLSRFRMLVRDLAVSQGKEIDFVLSGGETTVDKDLVDALSEPLLHLVRNAVDHGIETPAEREAAGKPRAATITLAARQASNMVEIAVVDDGRGIDRARISRKAREKGIRVEGLDDRSLLDLIFLPAFSTRDGVTLVSGRGIGLDIVKANVERLGGTVFVQTLPGRGTEFRLTIPLTLALGHALLLEAGRETFALPTGFVAETVRIDGDAMGVVERDGVLPWRNERLPAVAAARLFGLPRTGREDLAVILAGGGRRKALLVDRVVGHLRLVIKPLDPALGRPPGISAATLLGDGRIVMILDAGEILESSSPGSYSARRQEAS